MASVIENKMAKLQELQDFETTVRTECETAIKPLREFAEKYTVDESLEKAKKAIVKEYLYRVNLALKYFDGENRKGQKGGNN